MRMEMFKGDVREFSIAIKSLKHDRLYILNLFNVESSRTHIVYNGRIYNSGDIYRKG